MDAEEEEADVDEEDAEDDEEGAGGVHGRRRARMRRRGLRRRTMAEVRRGKYEGGGRGWAMRWMVDGVRCMVDGGPEDKLPNAVLASIKGADLAAAIAGGSPGVPPTPTAVGSGGLGQATSAPSKQELRARNFCAVDPISRPRAESPAVNTTAP